MAFPENTTLLDNFNRTETPLSNGGKWTTSIWNSDQALIANGTSCGNQNNTWCDSYWNVADFGPDLDLFLTLAAVSTNVNTYIVIAFRLAGALGTSPTGYGLMVQVGSGPVYNWRFERYDSNGSHNSLGAGPTAQAVAAGDSVGIKIRGTNFEGYYKASGGSWGTSAILSTSDANYQAAGKVGLGTQTGAAVYWLMDDFSGGTVSSATPINLNLTPDRLDRRLVWP